MVLPEPSASSDRHSESANIRISSLCEGRCESDLVNDCTISENYEPVSGRRGGGIMMAKWSATIPDTPTSGARHTAMSNIPELFLWQRMRLEQLAEKASGKFLIRTPDKALKRISMRQPPH